MKRTADISRAGVTIVESIVVIGFVGLISLALTPHLFDGLETGHQQLHTENKTYINAVVNRYYQDNGVWPSAHLEDIGANPGYFATGVPSNPVNPARPYTISPRTHRVDTP